MILNNYFAENSNDGLQDLYDAGEGRWGKDSQKFIQIMCGRSYEHLQAVFDEYNNISKRTIDKVISDKMTGDIRKGMLAIGTYNVSILTVITGQLKCVCMSVHEYACVRVCVCMNMRACVYVCA